MSSTLFNNTRVNQLCNGGGFGGFYQVLITEASTRGCFILRSTHSPPAAELYSTYYTLSSFIYLFILHGPAGCSSISTDLRVSSLHLPPLGAGHSRTRLAASLKFTKIGKLVTLLLRFSISYYNPIAAATTCLEQNSENAVLQNCVAR